MKSDTQEHSEDTSAQIQPASLNRRIFLMGLSMHMGLVVVLWRYTKIPFFKILGIPIDQESAIGDIGSFVIVMIVMGLLFMLEQSYLSVRQKYGIMCVSSMLLVIACLIIVPIEWYVVLITAAFWVLIGLIYSQLERWWKPRNHLA